MENKSTLFIPTVLSPNTDADQNGSTTLIPISIFSKRKELYVQLNDGKEMRARILLMLVHDREKAKSSAIKAFCDEARLHVSVADFVLSEELAKQVCSLQKNRYVCQSELTIQNLLIILMGEEVDSVVEKYVGFDKDSIQIREWSSGSDTLLEEYHNAVPYLFADLTGLFV